MRSRYKIVLGILGLLVLLAGLYAWCWVQPEARLRREFKGFRQSIYDGRASPDSFKTAWDSMTATGCKDTPSLIAIVADHKSTYTARQKQFISGLPSWVQRILPVSLDEGELHPLSEGILEAVLRQKADAALTTSLMRHEDSLVRMAATKAMLRDLWDEKKMPLKAFYPELNNPDTMVRNAVLIAIIHSGHQASDAQETLTKLIHHQEEDTRYHAALALLSTGSSTNLAMTTLTSLATATSPVLRYKVALIVSNPPPPLNRWIPKYEYNGFSVMPPDQLRNDISLFPLGWES